MFLCMKHEFEDTPETKFKTSGNGHILVLEQSSIWIGICFEITIKDYSGFRVLMGKGLDDSSSCEETDSKQKRFFKSQTAFDGNCSINAVNNAVGKRLITVADVQARVEKAKERPGLTSIPSKNRKLFSINLIIEVLNIKGYHVVKCGGWNMRSSDEKFQFLLSRYQGRFIVLTNVNETNQKKGGHDLVARNGQHWVAVSGDERLVLDSLARRLGPQPLTEEVLRRSTRKAVVRVYQLVPK